jgi:hypothetical protein
MTVTSPASARPSSLLFSSWASDHFLNPLPLLFFEMVMIVYFHEIRVRLYVVMIFKITYANFVRVKDYYTSRPRKFGAHAQILSELTNGIHLTWSLFKTLRRTNQGGLIPFLRPPVACESLRPRELHRCQTRGNTFVSGSSPVPMDAA